MHKTVTITIGEQLFTIEEDAYRKLEAYLASIRAHFAQSPDQGEIVSDIESRIAEEFAEALSARKKVIGEKDVEDVMKSMGSVADFEQFDNDASEKDAQPKIQQPWNAKLYRSADDQMIGGVCAGLAAYSGIETWIVRVIFIVLGLINGIGIIAYIILWVVLPEAKSATQKVEMSRGRVTLSAIQQKVNEVMPPEKRDGMLRKIVSIPAAVIRTVFLAAGRIVKFIVPLAGRVAGFGIILGTAFAVAMLTIGLLTLLTNPASILDFPLRETVGSANYLLMVFPLYFLVFIPLVLVMLAGISLLTLRSVFTVPSTLGLLGVWCIALVAGGVTAFSVSPDIETAAKRYEEEHFKVATKTYDFADFDRIVTGGHTEVTVRQGASYSVAVEALERDLPNMDVRLADSTLTMYPGDNSHRCLFFCRSMRPKFTVTMPEVALVDISGIAHADVAGFSGGETLALRADGNSEIVTDASVTNLEIDTDGIAHIRFTGSAETLKALLTGNSSLDAEATVTNTELELKGISHVSLAGSGTALKAALDGNSTLDADDFPVKTADMTLDGVSRATIDASDRISGTTDGNSRILYKNVPLEMQVRSEGISGTEQSDGDREGDYR